jgi:hypothetical protein
LSETCGVQEEERRREDGHGSNDMGQTTEHNTSV